MSRPKVYPRMASAYKSLLVSSEPLTWLSQSVEDSTHKRILKWPIQSSNQTKDKFLKHLTLNQINVITR